MKRWIMRWVMKLFGTFVIFPTLLVEDVWNGVAFQESWGELRDIHRDFYAAIDRGELDK